MRHSSRLLLVGCCVFLSGAASLGLEVVWSRLLELVFGSTTLAITTILVAYMLGLGLGGLLGGRAARRLANGVRVYGWMEVAIGLYAFFVPLVLAAYPALHRELLAPLSFWPAAFVRFALVGVVFLGPTLCMGATLPILVQGLASSEEGVAGRVGWLYGMNTLGAVAGVLGVTFVAFPSLGVRGTNTLCASLDVAVGLVAILWLTRRSEAARPLPAPSAPPAARPRGLDLVLVAYALVGCTALAYEVAWTRALSMVLGSSVYAFSTMLAGFLAGIALGSLAARRWLDRVTHPYQLFGFGVAALAVASLAVALVLRELPELFLVTFARTGISGVHLVWLGLAFSFLVMLAPTLVLGALFPLASRLVAAGTPGEEDDGRAVGQVYFANTLGSAAGAFLTGFVAIPLLGLRWTLGLAIGLDLALAAALLASRAERRRPLLALALAAGALLVWVRPPGWNAVDFASGVYYRTSTQLDFGVPPLPFEGLPPAEMLFYEEGINCTVSVHRTEGGLEEGGVSMRINGKTDASLSDMSTQVLSGHLPVLFGGREAKRALVIGYASGITTGSAALYDLEALDVCEIEGAVLRAARFFDEYNHRPLLDPRVDVLVEDGRILLETTERRYDVIVSEPSNPWISGCSNLFTAEFFDAAHRTLVPGGRLLQWVQLYGMGEDGLRSILAVMRERFGYVYGFLFGAESTDLMLLATDEPLTPADLPRWEELSEPVRRDLGRVRVFSTAELWSLLYLLPEDVERIARDAPVRNTDDSMYVELAAPWYLYDETPDTLALVLAEARGIRPLVEEADLPRGLLGELAVAYLERRSDEERGDALRALLERRGDRAFAALYDGERGVLVDGGEATDILALFDEAVRLAPSEFLPRHLRGWLLNQMGRYEDAQRDLELALALRPDQLEVRHQRMKGLASMQRMRDALQEADRLLASPLVETEPRLWAEGAFLYGGFGRFDEAIQRMRRYLELEPNSPADWTLLGRWYELTGRPADQASAERDALVARTNEARRYHWIGRWHERFGERDQAAAAFEEVLAIEPDNEDAAEDLRRLRE